MNREIEFRAKDNHGKWRHGSYVKFEGLQGAIYYPIRHSEKKDYIIRTEWCYVDDETVGQFTGLRDKNGVKIFEGDVLDVTVFDCFDNDKQYRVRVEWVGTEFMGVDVTDDDYAWNLCWLCNQDEEIEVIGNIHDNPSLLSSK